MEGEDGVRLATFTEHTGIITHIVFSPDGQTLSSGDSTGIVYLRDIGGIIRH